MVFSNLAGTTSDVFSITKMPRRHYLNVENGILLAGNTYDMMWNMYGGPEKYNNNNIVFINYTNITDLNDCFNPGQYTCSWSYYRQLKNVPAELIGTTEDFTMVVEPCSMGRVEGEKPTMGNGVIVQKLMNSLGRQYFRRYMNSVWTEWQKVASTSDLHAVATSGDYNTLINKPNVSAGPTVETGTFTLTSTNASVLAFPYSTYVKYGKIVAADISSMIQPNSGATGDIYLSGLPFLPEQNVKGLQVECNNYLEISGSSVWSFSATLSLLDNGIITVALNSLKGRSPLTCEIAPTGVTLTGIVTYIAK